MTKFLSLTLLIGLLSVLPSVFADGENGLLINPSAHAQTPPKNNGTVLLTLKAANIQVQPKWELDGNNQLFTITDHGELYLTATLSTSATVVATVMVKDMFRDLNTAYENLAATALITVEFISGASQINHLYLQAKVSDRPLTLHAFNLPFASMYTILAGNENGYFGINKDSGELWASAWTPPNNYTMSLAFTYTYSVPGIPPTEVISMVAVEITDYPEPTESRIYVLGGSDGNYKKDIWSSVNGVNWSLGTNSASWRGRYGHQVVTHNGRIYLLGGCCYKNDVWSSVNGINWSLETNSASWSGRYHHQAVSHNGRIYVLGGTTSTYVSGGRNDVWSSVNGINWSLETSAASWSARSRHQAVSHHNGRLYVLGGYYGGSYKNDVWSSVNGKDWSLETNAASWSKRRGHQAVAHIGRIYVLGGYYGSYKNDVWLSVYKNDVWSSVNGINWSLETNSASWSGRYHHQAVSHNGRIYVLGGRGYSNRAIYYNSVWLSADGKSWSLIGSADWSARYSHQAVVFPTKLELALELSGTSEELAVPVGYAGLITTLTARYGLGNYIYTILPSDSGFYMKDNGELWADGTATVGEHIITVQVTEKHEEATIYPATWTGKVIVICANNCKKNKSAK